MRSRRRSWQVENRRKRTEPQMGEATVVTGDTRADFMASKGKIAPSQGLPTKPGDAKKVKTEVSKTAEKQETAVAEAKAAEQKAEKSSIDERLSELTSKRKEAEKRAAEAEKRAAELEREVEISRRPKDSKPRPEDFQDPGKYGAACGEWLGAHKVGQR